MTTPIIVHASQGQFSPVMHCLLTYEAMTRLTRARHWFVRDKRDHSRVTCATCRAVLGMPELAVSARRSAA